MAETPPVPRRPSGELEASVLAALWAAEQDDRGTALARFVSQLTSEDEQLLRALLEEAEGGAPEGPQPPVRGGRPMTGPKTPPRSPYEPRRDPWRSPGPCPCRP